MRLNTAPKTSRVTTHEGAPAYPHLTPIQSLRRSVMSCMLWEDTFYENGQSIADRITATAAQCDPHEVAALAAEVREQGKLRHVPLLLIDGLSRTAARIPGLVSGTIEKVVKRPDDMQELLAIYWRNGRKPLPGQYKKGLARAFTRFDRYQLQKYDSKPATVKLRDVLFMCHAKAKNQGQAKDWQDLIGGEIGTANTWETRRSAGESASQTFGELLDSGKLGYMALLRNLRTMAADDDMDHDKVRAAILARKGAGVVLPFRFMSAAKHAPMFERELDQAMIASIADLPKLDGYTAVCVDCSGSMAARVSTRSEVSRAEVSATLASCLNGDNVRTWAFATTVQEVPHRQGMAGIDAIRNASVGWSTNIGGAVSEALTTKPDRIIVITDEQSHDRLPTLPAHVKGYFINTAPYQNGIGYGQWCHIDGFSENTLGFIHELEKL